MIYITGGAGFIGSRTIKKLSENFKVKSVDFLDVCKNHQDITGIETVDPHAFLDNFDNILKAGDKVIHQGACSDTMNHDPDVMMNLNFNYSKDLFVKCQKLKIPMIYASSAAVYGDGSKGFLEIEECENPLNLYAKSKKIFDDYVRCFDDHLTSQVVGLRYFNVYGKGEHNKGRMSSTCHQFSTQAVNEGLIKVFEGSNKFLRDFIAADDVVSVITYFLNNPKKSGIFNCGSGTPRSFSDMATSIQKIYPDTEIKEIKFPDTLKGKYQEFTRADLSMLRKAGYNKSFLSLEEGIKKALE